MIPPEEKDQALDLLSATQVDDKVPTISVYKDLTLNSEGKCFICFKGDEHLGSKYHDLELHKKAINQILERDNTYLVLMGDALETATKDSVGAGIFEQDQIVEEQLDAYVELHMPLAKAGKLLGVHMGNHEWRVFKHSGMNLVKNMVKQWNYASPTPVRYFGHGIFHYLQIGSQNYTIYTMHGGSGAIKPVSKLNSIINLQNLADADLYVMGHTHGLGHIPLESYAIDRRNKAVIKKERHFINSGTFLSHWGSYAHMKGYPPSKKGCPLVEFSGETKKIKVWIP